MDDQIKKILAIDTSTQNLKLAVSFGGDRMVKSDEVVEKSHGQQIIKMIDSLLKSAGLKTNEIQAIIVSTGPGSFTGLRIGIAAAKGMAVALGFPVVGVNLFEVAAYKLKDHSEKVTVVIPLKKDEFFVTETYAGEYDNDIKVLSDKKLAIFIESRIVAGFNVDFKKIVPEYSGKDYSKYIEYDAGDILYLGVKKLQQGMVDDLALLEPLYLQKSQAEINFELRNKK